MVLIESTQKSVEEILNSLLTNKRLEVPLYQREYSWGEKNWEEFYNDFLRSYQNKNTTDYWGNILLYDNGENYEIVDGQQRLITLFIFIHSLGKICGSYSRLPLIFKSDTINELWESLFDLNKDGKPLEAHERKDEKIFKAFHFFEERLRGKAPRMKTLYFKFLKKTQFSIVIVQDEFESYLLFGRLNTRGLHLTDIDLIKYEVFQNTDREIGLAGTDKVLKTWVEIQKKIKECKLDFNKFLSSWFEVYYEIDSDKTYEGFINKIDKNDYIQVLNELHNSVKNIYDLIKDNTGSPNRIKRNLEYLIKFSTSSKIYNVIITVADNSFDTRIRLVELLSVYEFVRSIIPSTNITISGLIRTDSNNQLNDVDAAYLQFSKEMKELPKQNVGHFISSQISILKKALKENLIGLEDFIEYFSNLRHAKNGVSFKRKQIEKSQCEFAIYTLNNWMELKNPTQGERYKLYDDPDYSIEHIIDKTFGDNENSFQFKIGNLVTLESAINNRISRETEFKNKLKAYKDSAYPQMKEFLTKNKRRFGKTREKKGAEWSKNTFSEIDVYNRGRYLALCFYEKLESLLESEAYY